MKINDLPHHFLPHRLSALSAGATRVDGIGHTISDTIQRAIASAGLNTQSGAFKSTSDTINSALSAAGLMPADVRAADAADAADVGRGDPSGMVIEGEARVIDTEPDAPGRTVDAPAHGRAVGRFLRRSFTNHAGSREYKLYVPSSYSTQPSAGDHARVPLVVMLHGCTQSAEDFAAGTRMNALAEQHGFLVAWPVQPSSANSSRCWNWFRPQDQARDSGEPALIAGITREVAASYRVDPQRIFVAGLSAGAAMAVILGATYPEMYAAIGAHSGLPSGVAHDLPSALAAMRGGQSAGSGPGARRPASASRPSVPIIVFHGDGDHTVHVRNSQVIVEAALAARADRAHLRVERIDGESGDGRPYRREIHRDLAGQAVAEAWTVRGAGHAWSGGSASGSFADARGPDASAEMVRFFLAQRRAITA